MPGVILAEALAQTAGIAAGQLQPSGTGGKSYRLSAIKLMKFLRSVLPETRVTFTATKTAEVGGLLQFQATAIVNGEPVAEGVIVLSAV